MNSNRRQLYLKLKSLSVDVILVFWTAFSFIEWKQTNNIEQNAMLDTAQVSRLLKDAKLAFYMQNSPCNFTEGIFANSVDGWNSGKAL